MQADIPTLTALLERVEKAICAATLRALIAQANNEVQPVPPVTQEGEA